LGPSTFPVQTVQAVDIRAVNVVTKSDGVKLERSNDVCVILKTSRLHTTSICGKHLSLVGYLPRRGTDHFYKYWLLVRFQPNVGRCDTTQIAIICLSSETFYFEHRCLPNKPVVEKLQVFAWLLLQCRITGTFIRCAYRGDVALEKMDGYPLRVFMDIYRTKLQNFV
jgi:hypothetical protein